MGCEGIRTFSTPKVLRRIAPPQYFARRYTAGENASRRDYRRITNRNAGSDERFSADPGPVAENDPAAEDLHVGSGPVVITGAKIGALRNADVRANDNRGQIIDPDIFAEPAVIARFEVPGKFDANARLDIDALADVSSKQSKDGAFEPEIGSQYERTSGYPRKYHKAQMKKGRPLSYSVLSGCERSTIMSSVLATSCAGGEISPQSRRDVCFGAYTGQYSKERLSGCRDLKTMFEAGASSQPREKPLVTGQSGPLVQE